MRAAIDRARADLGEVPSSELRLVAAAMALTVAIVVAYVALIRPDGLPGDQGEYHSEGIFFTEGKLWWSTLPFGEAHASAWKAALYPAWVGIIYELLGPSPTKVELIQALVLAPLSVALAWLLARHLFGARVAIWSALAVAVFPLAWEPFGLLYPEALAIPLTTLVLLLSLNRTPRAGLAVATDLVIGVTLLVRPTSFFLLAGVVVAWVIASGWRRGLGLTALCAGMAALVVLPWTIRNTVVNDGDVIPISVQDAAAYGTFNEDAANDPVYPYAWRPLISEMPAVFEGPPVSDAAVRSGAQEAAFDYIGEHPFSLVEAFYWNGLSRLWDVRRPARAIDEVAFEGRSEAVTAAGLAMYYVALPLALFGLWRHRHRREIVLPVLAIALAASVVFISASGTRYRAPLEPLIAILAVAAVAAGPVAAAVRPGRARLAGP